MSQLIAAPGRNVAPNNVMPVKSVILPPGGEQRVRVGDANAALPSMNKTGFEKLAYDTARMSLIQTGDGGQGALLYRLGGLHKQPSRYSSALWSECTLRSAGAAEAVGIAQVLIEDTGNDDARVS